MKLSVIIPFYNAEQTLLSCLSSVYNSDYKQSEIIAVNDQSTDFSLEIAEQFPCKILTTTQKGEAQARNLGAKRAQGDILVFIDADVVIKKDSFDKIIENFRRDESLTALTGLLSAEHPNKNFFSQYKNLYLNYVLHKTNNNVNFLYGSICAIKREAIEPFTAEALYAMDTELGMRLAQKGEKIFLDKTLEVIHLKQYTPFSFLANDFLVPYSWAFIYMKYNGAKCIKKDKAYAHAGSKQLVSVSLAPALLISALLLPFSGYSIFLFVAILVVELILNKGLLQFFRKEKGNIFLAKAVPVAIIDLIVMFCGVTAGVCRHAWKK